MMATAVYPFPTSAPGSSATIVALREALDGEHLHAEHAGLRGQVRDLLARLDLAAAPPSDVDTHRAHTSTLLTQLADAGVSRIGYPSEVGGDGDPSGAITLLQLLGHIDLSLLVKAGVQWGLFGGAILALGTEQHHERHLPAVMSLALAGCFAMTETGHGSDVASLRTTAIHDPTDDTFVVHTPDAAATKDYIGNAARDGRMAVVFAQLHTGGAARGVHALLVPIRDGVGQPWPGVTITDCGTKGGLNGVDNGRLRFDHVRVPREALLDRYGSVATDGTYSSPIDDPDRRFFTMLGTLVRGRIAIAGGAGAAAQSALAIAVRYANRRRQFASRGGEETLLLDYLTHQRRLLPSLATAYALQFAQLDLLDASRRTDGDDDAQRRLETDAAGLKAYATAHATATIQTCREACGGAGYLAANRLTQLKADSDVFTTFEGDNTVLLQLVTKGLLTDYRRQFGELDVWDTVRFVANTIVGTAAERSGARALVGRFSGVDVTDAGWQRALLADRADHVLEGLARRLRRAGASRDAIAEAFLAAQDHALAAATAHIELRLYDAFAGAIERCDDPSTALLLQRLRGLFALRAIERDRGWFLEHGRLAASTAKAVVRGVNDACADVRPHASDLVDGFAIPAAWTDTPMLRS